MTSNKNRTLLLYHLKLCALIYSHLWIPTGVTVRKCLIGVKIVVLSACGALKFSTSKKKRAPIQCPSSFVHYFVAICEFKLVLQSGNAQFRSKSSIFWLTRPDRWPWNTTGCIFNATSSFVHNFRAICEFKLRLESGNAQFRSKSSILWCVRSWNLTNDLKTIGHLFYATSSFAHHFVAMLEFKLELWSGNGQIQQNLYWPISIVSSQTLCKMSPDHRVPFY